MLKEMEVKREIYVSVLVTLLTIIFIDPILKTLWSVIIWFGSTTYKGILNSFYVSAALGHRNHVDVLIFILLLSIFVGFAGGIISRQFGKTPFLLEKIKSLKYRKTIIILSMIFWILCILFEGTSAFVDLQLNTSFQQRLAVLAPSVSDQEYKELVASWAKMKNRSDYELIVSQMDSLAAQNNIELPVLLLK